MNTQYAVQVLYNEEWIWVTRSVNDPMDRVLVTFTDKNAADTEAEQLASRYPKTRVVKLDD